jgi:hypothetical protein
VAHAVRCALAFRQVLQRLARRLEVQATGRDRFGTRRQIRLVQVFGRKRGRTALCARPIEKQVACDRQQVGLDAPGPDAIAHRQRAREGLRRNIFGKRPIARQKEGEAEDILRVAGVQVCEVHVRSYTRRTNGIEVTSAPDALTPMQRLQRMMQRLATRISQDFADG